MRRQDKLDQVTNTDHPGHSHINNRLMVLPDVCVQSPLHIKSIHNFADSRKKFSPTRSRADFIKHLENQRAEGSPTPFHVNSFNTLSNSPKDAFRPRDHKRTLIKLTSMTKQQQVTN